MTSSIDKFCNDVLKYFIICVIISFHKSCSLCEIKIKIKIK
jgi:hypothetical protein